MTKLFVSFNAVLISILAFFGSTESKESNPMSDMPMCSTLSDAGITTWANTAPFAPLKSVKMTPSRLGVNAAFGLDTTTSYSMPLLSQTPQGEILLSWTEKDAQGITAFCLSFSTDNGKTFSEKKVIYAGTGVSNSRLFRAKVLAKKDGSLVAVFANRADAPPPATAAAAPPQNRGGRGGRGGGGGRASELVFTVSKDHGATWTSLQSVDSDPTKVMRGFFDATLMANDEVAVAYLKDVKGSTKHEERDLRLVTTKNGVFQPEKLIDAVVCDCCNINLLTDASGALNVYYRDNNDDIRDIARLTSTDNGETFAKSQIVHADGWKIAGCPHSGAVSSTQGKTALVAWYSGAETESGIRLVTQEGKKLFTLTDQSVKNPALMGNAKESALLWEQKGSEGKTQLVFRKVAGEKVSETIAVEGSTNATNSTGLMIGNQLLIAHEVKQDNKKNSLKIATVAL
ncbi:MAG: sialidase family protein [Saprospiraceae bacterium]|nr:sialidase family protein [Saprospiraceae bacterium]